MKSGRTLQELAIELDRQNKAKRDYVLGTQNMFMSETADAFSLLNFNTDKSVNIENSHSLCMTELFHRQLGDTLQIPAKYYDKCRTELPELLSQNVNAWFRNTQSRHTVRTLDGTARAFLSDRYRRIDNYQIAEAVLPIIGDMPQANVESCEITSERMFIKVVHPRLQAEVSKGDIVQAGIVISNSEVGLGSVSVMPLVFRLLCLNGMVINSLGKKKYHVGRTNEESWDLYSNETLQADDKAFMLKLGDTVRTAVDEAKFATVVERLKEASEAKITGNVESVVELTSQQYGFNKSEQSGILQHLIQGGDLSLYGLSNAVTRTSQDIESYDRASMLEAVGWQVVTMEAKAWRDINRHGTKDWWD